MEYGGLGVEAVAQQVGPRLAGQGDQRGGFLADHLEGSLGGARQDRDDVLDGLGATGGGGQRLQLLEEGFGGGGLKGRRVAKHVVLGGFTLASGKPGTGHAQDLEGGAARRGDVVVEDVAGRGAEPDDGIIAGGPGEKTLGERCGEVGQDLEFRQEVTVRLGVDTAIGMAGVGLGSPADSEHRLGEALLGFGLVRRNRLEGRLEAERRMAVGHGP